MNKNLFQSIFLSLLLISTTTAYSDVQSLADCGDSTALNGKVQEYIRQNAYCYRSHEEHIVQIFNRPLHSLSKRLELIRNAESEIVLDYFLLSDDRVARVVLNEIINAKLKKPELKVQILVDYFGSLKSYWNDFEFTSYLKDIGIEVKIYNQANQLTQFRKFNHRSHRKIFIIDQKHLIMGGRNFADEYYDMNSSGYIDRDIYIQGQLAEVAKINFNELWNHTFSKYPEYISNSQKKFELKEGDIETINYIAKLTSELPKQRQYIANDLLFVTDKPYRESIARITKTVLNDILSTTQTDLKMENYLFMPVGKRQQVLTNLVNDKNVNVDVLTNGNSGGELMAFYLNHIKAKKLTKNGIQVFEYGTLPLSDQIPLDPSVTFDESKWKLHTKAFVLDNKTSIIGSHNYDPRSADINIEDFVVVFNQEQIAQNILDDIKIREDQSKVVCRNGKYCDGTDPKATLKRSTKIEMKVLTPLLKFFLDLF